MRCSSIWTPGSGSDLGPGRDHDVLGGELLPAAAVELDLDPAGAVQPAGTLDRGHLVLAEQELDALGQLLDHLALLVLHGAEVELDGRHLDAVGVQAVARLGVELGRVEQRLGRDAADVQAGAAERAALVDAGHPHAELGRPDRADIAAGPGADDHQIEALVVIHLPVAGLGSSWALGQPSPSSIAGVQTSSSRRSGVLDAFLDPHQEAHRLAAVDDAVVVGQREVHHRPDRDLALHHHRALLDLVHAEDADLRRVEDRRAHQRAVDAAVGDREGAAHQVLHRELAVARPCAELADASSRSRRSPADRRRAPPAPRGPTACRPRRRCRSGACRRSRRRRSRR